MSILLVDIGNTRIKWALWREGRLTRQLAAAHAGWEQEDFERNLFGGTARQAPAREPRLTRILVSSVAGPRIDRPFAAAARMTEVTPEFARSLRGAAGVRTRYSEPWRLGVDRFLAAIAAHHLARGRPACAVGIGTAATVDLIDARGVHRGGAIAPGPALMVQSLLKSTEGIELRAQGGSRGRAFFARNTRAAIEQGARYALAALIERTVHEARDALGRAPKVFLTGGAAEEVEPLIRVRFTGVPDLVIRGLALHAGLRLTQRV